MSVTRFATTNTRSTGPRGAWPYYCVEAVQSPCSGAAASVMAVLLATDEKEAAEEATAHSPREAREQPVQEEV